MKFYVSLLISLITIFNYAQESKFIEQDLSIVGDFRGTLLLPTSKKPPLVILLAGSGPLDKDGNTNFLKGNMLKKLAETLSNNNIATFRYDKYSLRQIKKGKYTLDYTFDAFINDAKAAINYFKSKSQFGKIYVLGHSQGSLVGMVAAKGIADGFISIAGAGQSIDEVITFQINASAPQFTEDTKRVFGILKQGKTTDNFPEALASIFNKETQPFMISWIQYNPQDELKKLDIPVLILNGTTDIQVTEDEANLLHSALPDSKLIIVNKMNHALVTFEGDRLENMKSYNEPKRLLSEPLIEALIQFIK